MRGEGHSRLALAAFELFFTPWRARRLRAARIGGLPALHALRPDLPLLVVANHVSWWDGFLLRDLHRSLRPDASLHFVMLQSELARRPLFRLLGAVGIDPRSPASVAAAVRELRRRVRARPDSVILFFPQGRIWPSHRRPLGFKRGVELFARQLAPVAVLPVGIHLEPLNAASPTAFVSAGEPVVVEPGATPDVRDLEARVEARLDAIHALLAERGEQAIDAWK